MNEVPGASLLSAAAAIAAGTASYGTAHAEPIRYDAAEPITWQFGLLDITVPASLQEPGRFYNAEGVDIYLYGPAYDVNSYLGIYDYVERAYSLNGSVALTNPTFERGQLVGGSASFRPSGVDFTSWIYAESNTVYGYTQEAFARFESSLPLDGSVAYSGVRLIIDGAVHYGWIAFSLYFVESRVGVDRFKTQITAWGYETEAGVAIAAGVPGSASLGVLALGAAGALGRRKRAA